MRKKCRKCGETKLLSAYAKSGIKQYPYRGTCKQCNNEMAKQPHNPLISFCKQNGLKICSNCQIIKSIDSFYKIKNRQTSNFKECKNTFLKAWRKSNRQKVNKIAKTWRDKNEEKVKETNQVNYLANREKIIENGLKITEENITHIMLIGI